MRLVSTLLCVAGMIALLDGSIFHSGLYDRLIDPSSAAGAIQNALSNGRYRSTLVKNQVLAVGDSRMDFRLKTTDQNQRGGRSFGTIAVPGSTPRCWFYMLRAIDPDRNQFTAILLPFDDYIDEDWEDHSTRLIDLAMIAPLLTLRDIPEFCSSYPTAELKARCVAGLLAKGWTYQQDLQRLLRDYKLRQRSLDWTRTNSYATLYNFPGTEQSLEGLTVDWQKREFGFPPQLSDARRRGIEDVLLRGGAPQLGTLTRYRLQWYGKIAARYAGTKTKLIYFQLPRGPLVRPTPNLEATALRTLSRDKNSITLSPDLFEHLERPKFFIDAMHLNRLGSERFTDALVSAVSERLDRP